VVRYSSVIPIAVAPAALGPIYQVQWSIVNQDSWPTLSHRHRLQGLSGTGSNSRHLSPWASFQPVSLHYTFETHLIFPLYLISRAFLTSLTHALWYRAEPCSSDLSASSSCLFSVRNIYSGFLPIFLSTWNIRHPPS